MKNHNILIILAVFLAAIALTTSLLTFQGLTGHVSANPGDTIILRPNADGDHTGLDNFPGPNGNPNWDKVDENVSDNDSTYVSKKDRYDLYQFENSSENLSISAVKVVLKCKNDTSDYGNVKVIIKTYGNEYEAPSYITVTNSYEDYSYTFPFNPRTGSIWTWDEINNIQAGPKTATKDVRCTQVWIEVETCTEAGGCECNLTGIEDRLDELEGRINDTEQQLADLNDSFNYFVNWTNENLTEVWDELGQVQTEIGDMNDTLNSFMNWTWDQFDDLQDQLNDLQNQINSLQNQTWSMLVYGFHDIITSTRIETFYNPMAQDPVSFVAAVPPSFITIYRIAVAGTGPTGPCYQVLKWGAFIPSNTLKDFTDEIKFGQSGIGNQGFTDIGTYNLNIIMQRPWWSLNPSSSMLTSQDFRIDVVALESFIENSTITDPANDSNNFSSQQNVSWQRGGLIWMNAILGENTPGEDNYCDVYYDSNLYPRGSPEYTEYIARLPMYSGNGSKYCYGDILTTKMDNGNQGIYRVCAEAEFIGSYDQEDCINLGIDNLVPVIYGAWPSESGAVNGIRYFYANVGDDESSGNWSGVEHVWMELINKSDFSFGNFELDWNESEGNWGITLNTSALPDDYYTLKVTATDAANNTAIYSIDPVIDNTAPVINSITLSSTKPSPNPDLFYRGYPITITANITDNLAGVDDSSVYATVDSTNVALTKTGADTYSGDYTTGFDEAEGGRTATVYAEDLATNPTSDSKDFNMTYSYNVLLYLNTTTANKGDHVKAYGTAAYDNGTLIDNETMMMMFTWDENVTINVINGTFARVFRADRTGTVTALITAGNGETYTDSEQITVPGISGGGGGGCSIDWHLISCAECGPSGTKECVYEDKGTCGKGTETRMEACASPEETAPPENVYQPSSLGQPTTSPTGQKPSLWPRYIGIGAGALAVILAISAYFMYRKKK